MGYIGAILGYPGSTHEHLQVRPLSTRERRWAFGGLWSRASRAPPRPFQGNRAIQCNIEYRRLYNSSIILRSI